MWVDEKEIVLSDSFDTDIRNLAILCAKKKATDIKIGFPLDLIDDEDNGLKVVDSGKILLANISFEILDNEDFKNDD